MPKHIDPDEIYTASDALAERAPDSIEIDENGNSVERYGGDGIPDILRMPHSHVQGSLFGWGLFHPEDGPEIGIQFKLGGDWVPLMLTMSPETAQGFIDDLTEVLSLEGEARGQFNG